MIKLLSILVTAMVLLLASLFITGENEILIRSMVPSFVKAGEDCLVIVKIEKGNLSGLARLQQFQSRGRHSGGDQNLLGAGPPDQSLRPRR